MLLKTYERILEMFRGSHGYMSFEELKEEGITVTQIQELTEKGVLEKFARMVLVRSVRDRETGASQIY